MSLWLLVETFHNSFNTTFFFSSELTPGSITAGSRIFRQFCWFEGLPWVKSLEVVNYQKILGRKHVRPHGPKREEDEDRYRTNCSPSHGDKTDINMSWFCLWSIQNTNLHIFNEWSSFGIHTWCSHATWCNVSLHCGRGDLEKQIKQFENKVETLQSLSL